MILRPGLRVRVKDGGGEGNVVRITKIEHEGVRLVEVRFLSSVGNQLGSRLHEGVQPKRIKVDKLEVWNHETKLYEPAEAL